MTMTMESIAGAWIETPRAPRMTIVVIVTLVIAAACQSSSASGRINTPPTAGGLATARTTLERAMERADTNTIRAFFSATSCTTGKQGRQLEWLLAKLKPAEYRSSIRVATRNVTSERGEVHVRTHYSAPGESGSTNGDWEAWRFVRGRWRADCSQTPQSARGSNKA
jgi:hypothetical protein